MTKWTNREHFNRSTTDTESANAPGASRGVGGAVPCDSGLVTDGENLAYLNINDGQGLPTKLLTGGSPSSFSPTPSPAPNSVSPTIPRAGGYDGGIEIGFDATWDDLKFPGLVEKLEEAKNLAGEVQKGPEGISIGLAGEEVLVMPTGGKVGGLLYKYRFICRGVEFLIHSNPPKGRQPVRVRYLAESLIGQNFFAVHEQFVMPFLKRLGLTVHADKPSRIDMQVLIDVPSADFCQLFESGHVVTKLRKFSIDGSVGQSINKETLTLGTKVQVCIYDKRAQMPKMGLEKSPLFQEHCVGDEWFNSDRPITRIEIRLSRDALKCLGVNTVADLKARERAVVDLVTHDWFRILEKPKVRGCENTAAIHPVWERIRELFATYFSGADVDVKWNPPAPVSCDPVALEKQAVGCLAKALAVRKGEQATEQSSMTAVSNLLDLYKKPLHEKINTIARHTEIKTGIKLGQSSEEPSWKAELREYYRRSNQEYREKLCESEQEPVQSHEEPLATESGSTLKSVEWYEAEMDRNREIHRCRMEEVREKLRELREVR